MFFIGRGYQFKIDESIVNQSLENEDIKIIDQHFFNQIISDSHINKFGLNNKF